MGKGAEPADTKGAAETEGQYGRQAARDEAYANRPDQYNAFGNLTWQRENVRDPSTGEMTTKWTQRENLSPNMQYIFDRQMNTAQQQSQMSNRLNNRALSSFAQAPNWGQFGQVQQGAQAGGMLGANVHPTTGANFNTMDTVWNTTRGQKFRWDSRNRQRAEDASYSRATSRLDPQFKEAREAKRVQLRNQGLKAGDQAFEAEMDRFNRGRTDAYSAARQDSVGQGRMEDQQSFGQAQNAFGMNLGSQQQEFNQRLNHQTERYRQQLGSQQQAYAQKMGSAQNIRQADQQRFTQEQQSSDQANALRDQQIQEYLNKRNFAFEEQQRLNPTQDVQELSQTFGSQGGK